MIEKIYAICGAEVKRQRLACRMTTRELALRLSRHDRQVAARDINDMEAGRRRYPLALLHDAIVAVGGSQLATTSLVATRIEARPAVQNATEKQLASLARIHQNSLWIARMPDGCLLCDNAHVGGDSVLIGLDGRRKNVPWLAAIDIFADAAKVRVPAASLTDEALDSERKPPPPRPPVRFTPHSGPARDILKGSPDLSHPLPKTER